MSFIDIYFKIIHSSKGQRRFARPEPPVQWTGVRDATRFGSECYQRKYKDYEPFSVNSKPLVQSEDCLFLNVYTPAHVATNRVGHLLPVMVWIHGGGYVLGAGSQYDGSELAAFGDVVVVTINYRLDVFGFLSDENKDLPGNYGMLDQIMALRWIQNCIGTFGGDPNMVTIFGQSAGSSSVSLLVLSPLAKGLFHRAIMESGVSLSHWAVTSPVAKMTPRSIFSLISKKLGCDINNDITQTIACLRWVDARELMNASVNVENIYPMGAVYGPRVENVFSFLPDIPMNLWMQNKSNQVDTIRGYTGDEAGESVYDPYNQGLTIEQFVKGLENDFDPYNLSNQDELIKLLTYIYIGHSTDTIAIRSAMVKAFSDYQFVGPSVIEACLQAKLLPGKKHYLYEFDYKPSFSPMAPWLNATHMEEIPFIFGLSLPEFRRTMSQNMSTQQDNSISHQMQTMWTNFAKYGNPTQTIPTGGVPWPTLNVQNTNFLKIDKKIQTAFFKHSEVIVLTHELMRKMHTYYNHGVIAG